MTKAYILVNLGAPADSSRRAAEDFLREFLSDSCVLSLPFFIRYPLARMIARKSAAGYCERGRAVRAGIENGEHPLVFHTRKLAEKIRAITGVSTLPAFRYGNSLAAAVAAAREFGAQKIVFLPMYPQRARSTSESSVKAILKTRRRGDDFRCVLSYCDDSAYIDALSESVLRLADSDCSTIFASFHSLPVADARKTPYGRDCARTVRLLSEKTKFGKIELCWQSRMGRGKWLEPSAESSVDAAARRGEKKVGALCPGFACDCSETLLEIGRDLRARFESSVAGGSFEYAECLNSSDAHAKILAGLFERHSDEKKSKI